MASATDVAVPAPSRPAGDRPPACRYFFGGSCREGDRCAFSHDPADVENSRVCQFFLKGACKFGNSCRFQHPSSVDSGSPMTNGTARVPPAASPASRPPPSSSTSSSASSTGGGGQRGAPGVRRPPRASSGVDADQLSAKFTDLSVMKHVPSSQPESVLPVASHSSVLSSATVAAALSADAPVFVPRAARQSPVSAAAAMAAANVAVVQQMAATYQQQQGHQQPGVTTVAFQQPPPQQMQGYNPDPMTGTGGHKSWAEVVNPVAMAELSIPEAESQLCPFGVQGECRYGDQCQYIHGEVCDMCGKAALHPTHQEQRSCHAYTCLRQHEEDMEHTFAIAKSKEKTCGICMEVVLDKSKGEARFGIMPNCNHCFCLSCLRKWRQAEQFENRIVRACPECRQTSDYICPSRYWVDTKEEKDKLLTDYRAALRAKQCKYFKRGDGECPFGNKCFYSHMDHDGKPVDVGPPPRQPRRAGAEGELELVERLLLVDFFEARDAAAAAGEWSLPPDVLELMEMLSDGDDSDSEMNVFYLPGW